MIIATPLHRQSPRFQIASSAVSPFSRRISVDRRSDWINKAAFLNSSGVV